MDFERDTLTAVMEARAKAMTATGPADAAQKEGQLSQALGRLLAVAENYPTLKSNDNVKMLQEELSATENKVGFARQFYNDIATKFNTAQQMFPTNLFAGMFGFKPAELFEITDAGRSRGAGGRSVDRKYAMHGPRILRVLSLCDRMNLYEQQAANRRRTWLIMVAFIALLCSSSALGFDAFFIGAAGGYVPIGIDRRARRRIGVRAGRATSAAIAPCWRPTGAQRRSRTLRPAATEADTLKLRQLENVVDEMAIAAGVPRPQVYVVPDADPNAFATGRGPGARVDCRHARVCSIRSIARSCRASSRTR